MLNKTKKEGRKNYLILGIIVVILLFFLKGKIAILNDKISVVLYPVQAKIYFLGEEASKIYDAARNYSEILEKNREYERENLLLAVDRYKYNQILEENERLKSLLEIKQSKPKIKIGIVNFRSISDLYKNFSINLGIEDGITKEIVAISGNNLVGRVTEVYSNHSKIEMITSDKVFISSVTENGVMGIIRGDDEYPNRLTFSPSVIQGDVQIGDKVFTSGISDVYPKDLVIGEIISVGDTETEFIVQPEIDLLKLQEVILISREVN